MTTQIHQEHLALINSPQLLLCDRSVLDQWVYWKKLLQETTWNEQLAKRHEVISHLFHFWLPSYALICHVRCDWKTLQKRLKKDALRGVHAEQVKKFEELFLQTINEEQIKPVEIWNNLSLDECAQNVIQEISARKLLP
jgi:deoxyadenosine/deoxycytidine kinase